MAGGSTSTSTSNTVLLLSFATYVMLTIGGFYWCILADPDESRLAELFQVKIPRKLWATLSHFVGKGSRTLRAVEWFVDRFLLWVYCVVVFGTWALVFYYIYPWMDQQMDQQMHHQQQQQQQQNHNDNDDHFNFTTHKYIGYAVFACCVGSWRWAAATSPGLITRENVEQFLHCYPYDHLMFLPSMDTRLQIPRLPRSKFDRFKYKAHVPRYDHFCGWIHNTVGEQNYRFFLAFLLVHALMCAYGTVIVGYLFYLEIQNRQLTEVVFFNRSTGEEFKATRWIIFQYLFHSHTPEASVLAIMVVMAVALTSFLLYHCYLICTGFTTNEAGKWNDIMRWYKQELKRYNEAVVQNHPAVVPIGVRLEDYKKKKNLSNSSNEDESSALRKHKKKGPEVSDGDVTCTGQQQPSKQPQTNNSDKESRPPANAAQDEEEEQEDEEEEAIEHPGPWPINIYNRGIIENWKEVFFPPSLRPENVQRLAAAQHSHTQQRKGAVKPSQQVNNSSKVKAA